MPKAWCIDEQGWLNGASRCPSPNVDARPQTCEPELLVVHYISLPPGEFGGPYVHQLFCNELQSSEHPYFEGLAGLKVSAHFFIARTGKVTQFVPGQARAWHSGVSRYRGPDDVWRERCNDFSIGIELEGDEQHVFTAKQYRSLAALSKALRKRYGICALTGHQDIAPGRKTDPGPMFDWDRFVNSIGAMGPWYRFVCDKPHGASL